MLKRILTFICALGAATLIQVGSAVAATSSSNVALVPGASGQAYNGGTMPTTGFPGGFAPSFTDISPAAIQNNPTDPLAGFDTVALIQVCNIGTYLQDPQFKSRLENFVSRGGKLIIWDSECTNTDYSSFVYPFSTSNPGAAGANGTLQLVEDDTLGSPNPASSYYINDTAISTGTDAVGDANVFVTYTSQWCAAETATNTLGVNGPVQVYARLGSGLIIYNGLDMDMIGYSSSFDPASSSGATHLNRLWYLQLLQSFNPDSGLPCGVQVFGIQLTPKSASNPEGASHTVTARVTSNAAPQSGVSVTFSVTAGPNAGQSGTATTAANGVATWTYADNGGIGADTISASANLQGHSVSDTATKNWTEQPIVATGSPFSATEGQKFAGTVASFTDPFTKASASEYSATIDWGDGHTSSGTITGSGGRFTVAGSHVYAEEGSYVAKVTITDIDTPTNAATVNAAATVADAALKATGVTISTSGQLSKAVVANFTDAYAGAPLSDFTATIKWGDGSTGTGTVSSLGGGRFKVLGSHTYKKPGTYHPSITIKDKGGSSATATSTIVVAAVRAATILHGQAKLAGVPRACVRQGFTARVAGSRISSVTWMLDGKRIAGRTMHAGTNYQAYVAVSKGTHKLTVKVTFLKASQTKPRNFRASVSACVKPKSTTKPTFTG